MKNHQNFFDIMFKFLKTHKMSVLSALLVIAAALLGADLGFAMAVDPVDLAPDANPSENLKPISEENPGGRPADETPQQDEQGFNTQMQGHAATATDVRDAGLEAEDYDADVDEFQKFKFPTETLIARKCRPVKVKSYVHGHYRTGSTDLTAVYTGESVTITAGVNSAGVYTYADAVLLLPRSAFDNVECLLEYSTVLLRKTAGYRKDEEGNEVHDGEMVLYVLDHKDSNAKIRFKVLNPPIQKESGTEGQPGYIPATSVTIANDTKFVVLATAGTESQMHVAPETYLPVKSEAFLQKKISTAVITEEFEDQDKKVAWNKNKVLRNMETNFKRKCSRSHWAGTGKRVDVWVPEINGREAAYTELGVIRQIPMLYTYGAEFNDDDLLAISTLMFTNNSVSDEADVACGKKALQRLIKYVNSTEKYRDIGKVEVSEFGIVIRRYRDNFGTLNFYWDQQLDDLGYEEYMFAIDWTHADRPYKVNDKSSTRDMSKTGEAREAKEYNLCRIDCVRLNGFNAVMIVPSNIALDAANTGGIQAEFVQTTTLADNGTDVNGDAISKAKKYYLTQDIASMGFSKGDVAEYDSELETWVHFEGLMAKVS